MVTGPGEQPVNDPAVGAAGARPAGSEWANRLPSYGEVDVRELLQF